MTIQQNYQWEHLAHCSVNIGLYGYNESSSQETDFDVFTKQNLRMA